MIWDVIQESSFDSYFNNQSLEVQTLLLDQNIITELKNLNPHLINYIEKNKHAVIYKLIEYTTILPMADQTQDRIHKLPFVSSEVLAIDNAMIYNQFFINTQKFQGETYFTLLINILNTDAANNQILLGYFEKVMNNLYNCNKIQLAKLVFRSKQTFITHLNKPAVGTIIKNCIIILDAQQGIILSQTQRKAMVQSLIQKLAKGTEQERLVSGSVLVEIIQKFQTFSSGDQLLQHILKSAKLLQIFQQKDSNSIDIFLTGYLNKCLQKIYSSDNTYKSILELPKQHLQKTFQYLRRKRHILIQNFTELSNQERQFLNQSRKVMKKIDKRIIQLLHLIKLGMENKLSGILQSEDIDNLWVLLESHPFNDIIKIPIFKIFSLLLHQPPQSNQRIAFLSKYHQKSIRLYKVDNQMFGQHLFNVFRLVSKKENVNMQQSLKNDWATLEQYFKKCEQLAEEIQKTINRYSNRTKVIKLVVDEEDKFIQTKPQSGGTQNCQAQPKCLPEYKKQSQINTFKQDPFKANFTQATIMKTEKLFKTQGNKEEKKKDPFANFSFFQQVKVKQQDKNNKKLVDFSDFSAFM